MTRHFGWNAFAFGFGPRGLWGGHAVGAPVVRIRRHEVRDPQLLRTSRPRLRMMKELEDQMHGCYSPSPAGVSELQWLEDEGLVVAKDVRGKKVYEITDAGRKFSTSIATWWTTSSTACASRGPHAGRRNGDVTARSSAREGGLSHRVEGAGRRHPAALGRILDRMVGDVEGLVS